MLVKKFKSTRIYQIGRTIWFYPLYEIRFNLVKLLRLIHLDKTYESLLSQKNKYYGKRCFIIATGPSMNKEDLMKLKNEYTFGVNSLCKIFDETGWETTFFGIQDKSVYRKLKEDISKLHTTELFISSDNKDIDSISCKKHLYPFNIYNQKTPSEKFVYRFSDNIYKEVCGGFTIVYSMLQVAVYMGFKEIYLLGCDCNYDDDKKKRHFIESGHFDPGYKTVGLRMIEAYKVANDYIKNKDINIYNATRGGMLEIFPRVNLDEVLKENEAVEK